MIPTFKEWFSKVKEEPNILNTVTDLYKAHYPFIEEGYSDRLEDSEWNSL